MDNEKLPVKFIEKEEKKKSKKLSLPETPSLPLKIIETEGVEEITADTPDEVSNIPIKIIEVETEEVEKSAPPETPTPDTPIKIAETEVEEPIDVSGIVTTIPVKFVEGQETQSKKVTVESFLLMENGNYLLQENQGSFLYSMLQMLQRNEREKWRICPT